MKRAILLAFCFAPLLAGAAVHQIAKLTPVNTNNVRVAYPSSIAVSADGNTIVVGDSGAAARGEGQEGAVYVFVKPAGGWTDMNQTATLTANDGFFGMDMGSSVSISGNTIVAGAYAPKRGNLGRSYIFTKPKSGWKNSAQTAEITPSDGVVQDYFGQSVSISGNTIAVAAPGVDNARGAIYIYVEPATGWTNATETTKVSASDAIAGDWMDYVAISGNLVAAAANHNEHRKTRGAAYIFQGSGSAWTQIAELTPSDWVYPDIFGFSGSFNGDTLVLNAEKVSGSSGLGVAYVFAEPLTGWANMTETAQLSPPQSNYSFSAGSISANGTAILGTLPVINSGAAVVFEKPKTGWVSTSVPNLQWDVDDLGTVAQIGTPGIAALGVGTNGSSSVLLFAQ